jgi:hypothetical protein
MIRPAITQAIIDSRETISANLVDTQDGDGIPYWNEPDGVYSPSTEAEDEMEQGRR